jgi:uncharacterized protein YacL
MFLHALRAFFILSLAGVAMSFLAGDTDPSDQLFAWMLYHKEILLLVSLLLGIGVVIVDVFIPQKSLAVISAVFFGLVAGMVAAFALSLIIDLMVESFGPGLRRPVIVESPEQRTTFEPDPKDSSRTIPVTRTVVNKVPFGYRDHPFVSSLKLMLGVVLCYLSISFVLQTKDDIRFMIPYVEFARETRGAHPLLLDTSAIIDGRIADIAETRIIDAELIVPRFVLGELHTIADSADKLKRNRGRRGLDILNKLQSSPKAGIKILEVRTERADEGKGVDELLIDLASKLDGRVVTNDYNLNKIAQLRGVPVININDLANALKPVFIPGETMSVRIIKPGEEAGQGVGYLDDGTMVVVEAARNRVGEEVAVSVTSVLQTSAGRMIFGRPEGVPPPPRRPRPATPTA